MKNNLLKYYITAAYLFSTVVLFAQSPGTDDSDGALEGADAPAAPIDDYVFLLAIIGVVLVFLRFRALQIEKTKEQA